MRTTIMITSKEAKRIPLIELGKSNVSKNEIHNQEKEWKDNLFAFFKDVKGNKYLICHGTEEGLLFNPTRKEFRYTFPNDIYTTAINKGFIEDGEKLNIICCHVEIIKKLSNKHGFNNSNINFINKTEHEMWCSLTNLENGLYRLNCWTSKDESLLTVLKYKLQNAKKN